MGKWGQERDNDVVQSPVILAIGCFIINLEDSGDLTDKEAIGHLRHKLKSKVDENEEALKNGVDFEHIDSEWAFEVFKARYQEPVGAPIANRETIE